MVHIIVFYLTRLGGLLSRRDVILTGIFLSIQTSLGNYHNTLSELLRHSDGLYQTRSADWLSLHVPRVSSELAKTALSSSAPDSWNRVSQRRYRRGDKPPEAFWLEKSITLEMAVVWHISLPSPQEANRRLCRSADISADRVFALTRAHSWGSWQFQLILCGCRRTSVQAQKWKISCYDAQD